MTESIYLDYQATTPCDPNVVTEMLPYFSEIYGNPASTHAQGKAALAGVERAREQVAALINAAPQEIIFTSGATEANNIAIKGAARHQKIRGNAARRIITVATEHKCVLQSVLDLEAEGFEPFILGVQADGRVDPTELEDALKVPTVLVSVMAANNETGVLQDIDLLGRLSRKAGALFHTDAAQAAGRIPLNVTDQNLDLVSLSGHKIYGPKGIGALYVRRRPRVRIEPLVSGGGQERGIRSGTLAPALIVGFGAAAEIAQRQAEAENLQAAVMRDLFLQTLLTAEPGIAVNGSMTHRLGANLNLCFPDVRALDVIRAAPELSMSTGSACSEASLVPSYVLTAMGLDADHASRSLRLASGRFTSGRDMENAAMFLLRAIKRVRDGAN